MMLIVKNIPEPLSEIFIESRNRRSQTVNKWGVLYSTRKEVFVTIRVVPRKYCLSSLIWMEGFFIYLEILLILGGS